MALNIVGIDNMSFEELNKELERGGRFVVFEYSVSILIMTFKRPSSIYFIKGGEGSLGKSIKFTMTSLIAGWWGFPWGPIHTIAALFTNLRGGKDVTNQVIASFNES